MNQNHSKDIIITELNILEDFKEDKNYDIQLDITEK